MTLASPITDLELLAQRSATAQLLAWNRTAVLSGKLDRDELTLSIAPARIRQACAILRDDTQAQFNFLSDITAVDWHPSEPRFEVIYHLLSIPRHDRVRLKVQIPASDPTIESITTVWPAAEFFEREIFDLFGIRFHGHPYLRRIMMPEDWEGHPLRKDYPVEGYR